MKFRIGDKVKTTNSGYTFSKDIGTIISFNKRDERYNVQWRANYSYPVGEEELILVSSGKKPKYFNKILKDTIKQINNI